MKNNIYLSIIIPIYNEQKRLYKITQVYQFLNQAHFTHEIILIDDGSQDNTLKKLNELSKKFKFHLISYQKNKGKGFAVKEGMLAATGRYRLFIDIDLSTPIEELNKFFPYFGKHDIIIGSRKKKGAKIFTHQPKLREELGKGFTKLSQITLGLTISDFTCGFKCFSTKAAKQIFSRQKLDRWGFDSEILFLAKRLGFKVKEVPVSWSNDPNTKVKFPQDLIRSLLDLLRIRYYHFKKLYQ